MGECEYSLGNEEFHMVRSFLTDFPLEESGIMTIDACLKESRENISEIREDSYPALISIKKLGETLSDVVENMKSHIESCGGCRMRYKVFVRTEKEKIKEVFDIFKDMGYKKSDRVEAKTEPDFLGMYSQ